MNTPAALLLLFSMGFNIVMLSLTVKWAGRAKGKIAELDEIRKTYADDIAHNKAKLNEVFQLLDILQRV